MTRRLYIETVGCQMNVLDSEMVVASLRRRGFELAGDLDGANVIFFTTCSVGEKAKKKPSQPSAASAHSRSNTPKKSSA